MICKKCRKEIPDVSVYCMWCGRKQVQAERIKRRPNGAGSVTKVKGKLAKPWRARMTLNGHSVTVGYYETQAEGFKAIASYEPPQSSVRKDMDLGAVYDAWSAVKYDLLSRQAVDNYKAAWKRLGKLSAVSVCAIKSQDYQQIIDAMVRDKMSRSSCDKVRNLASQLSQWAMQNDLIDKNYAEFLVMPQRKENSDREYFTDDEVDLLWSACDDSAARIVLVMLYTGMRINELFSLKVSDLHLDEDTGHGRKVSYVIGGEKTDAGRNRVVVLHSRILPFVRQWFDEACLDGSQYLVRLSSSKPRKSKGKIDDHNFRTRQYYPLLERLGIMPLPPHKARHTFASRGAKAGVSQTVLQNLLGHEKYETTADYYTHVDLDQLADGVEMIDFGRDYKSE